MLSVAPPHRRHRPEEHDPYGHVGQVHTCGRPIPAPSTPAGALLDRTDESVDPLNAQVQKRHTQELVVERRGAESSEERVLSLMLTTVLLNVACM